MHDTRAVPNHCPKCQHENDASEPVCPRCGIVFSKYTPGPERFAPHQHHHGGHHQGAPMYEPAAQTRRPMNIPWGKLVALALVASVIGYFALSKPYEVVGPAPERAQNVVILLHGYGDTTSNFVNAAGRMNKKSPETSFVVVDAPLSAGLFGRAWFTGGSLEDCEGQISRAHARVLGVVDEVAAMGVPSDRIYLAGFSQGAQMALDVGVSEATPPLGGLILMSGGWPNWPGAVGPTSMEGAAALSGARVLLVHGTKDPVVDISGGRAIQKELAPYTSVQMVEYEGGHRISTTASEAVAAFLSE